MVYYARATTVAQWQHAPGHRDTVPTKSASNTKGLVIFGLSLRFSVAEPQLFSRHSQSKVFPARVEFQPAADLDMWQIQCGADVIFYAGSTIESLSRANSSAP